MDVATLNGAPKTDSGMLSQSRTLEARAADTPGQARNGRRETAAVHHGRGEPAEQASFAASRPKAPADGQRAGGNARVFVLDRRHHPLMPCHPARARELLHAGRAVVHRLAPFTIRLTARVGGQAPPARSAKDKEHIL